MSRKARRALPFGILVVLSLLATACGTTPDPYPVRIRAVRDGTPVGGADVIIGGRDVGRTGVDGILYVEIDGAEGEALSLDARCPPGHVDPEALPPIRLRRVSGFDADGAVRAVERELPCAPALRHAIVVIRTDGLRDLPVLLDGREVTRTNAAGVAHLAYRGAPDESFRVALSTDARPELRPRDPSRAFSVVADHDEVNVWNVELREPRQTGRGRSRPTRPSVSREPNLPEELR